MYTHIYIYYIYNIHFPFFNVSSYKLNKSTLKILYKENAERNEKKGNFLLSYLLFGKRKNKEREEKTHTKKEEKERKAKQFVYVDYT